MFAIVVTLLLLAPVPTPAPPLKAAAFLEECEVQRRAVAEFLNSEAAWKPGREAELHEALRVAGAVRPPEAVPALLQHIGYRDRTRLFKNLGTMELRYPVYAALKQYGPAAMPQIMAHLKIAEPPADASLRRCEELAFARLLTDAFGFPDAAEASKRLARARIEAELARTPQGNFPRLRELMDHVLLR